MSELGFLYGQTRQMRQTLLRFLGTVPPVVLTATLPEYGAGGILSTLTHVADCYGGWAGWCCTP